MTPTMKRSLGPVCALLLAACFGGRAVEGDHEENVSSQPEVETEPPLPALLTESAPLAGSVGDRCQVENPAPTLDSASLRLYTKECATGACLRLGLGAARCTRSCATASDCPAATPDCSSGFVCEAPLATSDSRCCKMCLCQPDAAAWITFQPALCAGVTPDCTALQSAAKKER